MNKYYYDFHIHSCLSPCGDNDMTPNNIAGMAALSGLNIVALTDHNSAKNCPAFFEAAKRNGIIPIAGMELTTAEDIHMVCLFESLGKAMEFDEFIQAHRMKIPNKTEIFGDQLILDGMDDIIGTDEFLLITATDITVDDAAQTVKRFGGICYPAHVDRESNGIIATLGVFPDDEGFICAGFHDGAKIQEYTEKYPPLKTRIPLVSSDAHYLGDIRDKEYYFELDDEPYSGDKVRAELFKILRGNKQ
ncbi:MAG: PHP domain-containing protein [Clostridia bacterium]|nr:PHP domain-containing protein [Clostridia bacterium]